MQRRAFLQFLCVGLGVATTATTAQALPALKSLGSGEIDWGAKPQSGVATAEDMDSAKVRSYAAATGFLY